MKKKAKKQVVKKKNEFRYHNIELINKSKKQIKIRHPAYVFLEKGNIYVYVSITHSKKVKDLVIIKLKKNPNPKDGRDSFWVKVFKEDTKDKFGRKQKGWSINKDDEENVRKEYKKR